MEVLYQWGILAIIFIVLTVFWAEFSTKIKSFLEDPEWNNIYIGAIIGIIISLVYSWYSDIDKKPYDWCWHLPESTAIHCTDLYYQSIEALKEESKRYPDQNCYQGLRGVECD